MKEFLINHPVLTNSGVGLILSSLLAFVARYYVGLPGSTVLWVYIPVFAVSLSFFIWAIREEMDDEERRFKNSSVSGS